MLTPRRIADRSPAPLARTAEVRLSPTVYIEQQPQSSDRSAALIFEGNDIAARPNLFAAFGFTDSLALLLPLGVLWSPVTQVERGLWLTVGGGIYGFAVGDAGIVINDALGVWAKRRFGADLWLSGGLACVHSYDSRATVEFEYEGPEHTLWLIPAIEAGLQITDAAALAILADYRHDLIEGEPLYSRLRAELIFVPIWWLDIGIHGGAYLHASLKLHVDPLVGASVTGRW